MISEGSCDTVEICPEAIKSIKHLHAFHLLNAHLHAYKTVMGFSITSCNSTSLLCH